MLFALSILALLSLASATQCPPHGSVRYMLPHETDCSKFYICAHGVPLLQSCPEGTHFNNNFMVCQNPVFAGCSNELPASELECSWPDFGHSRPHPDTCSKFYVCEFGTPLVFDCPGGTEFNAELRECVWPHESNCNIGAQTDAPEDTTDSIPLGDSGPEESGPEDNGPQDGGSQDGRCVEGALSAHSDCSKYNICNHGAQVAMDCSPGLQWSSKLKQCTWLHDSDCNNHGSDDSQTDASENESQDGGSQDGGSQDGGSQDGGSQDGGSQDGGSQDGGSQDGGSQDGGSQDGGSQDGGSRCEEGALSANEDCNKYNKCNHGVAVAMDCPPGLHWNAILQYCDWPLTAGCA